MNKKLIEEAIDVLIPKAGGASHPVANASIAIELLKQAIAPEPRFYFNQPVLCSDDGKSWISAFFRRYQNLDGFPFLVMANGELGSKYCKPDPDAVSLPNWLPTINGAAPVEVFSDSTEKVYFSKDKTMYCIIPEPKYLEVSDGS